MMISKALLIHSCTVKEIIGKDADRKPIYADEVELKNVWFDLTRAVNSASEGKETADTGTIFFDCANSSPSDFVPVENMVLIFDGKEYHVTQIKKCYGVKGLQHYEIGVK